MILLIAFADHTLGWTKYSDRTDKEFKMLLGRSQKSNVVNAVKMAAQEIEIVQPPVDFVAPRTIDWRTTPGVVSSIKDQVMEFSNVKSKFWLITWRGF